MSIADSDGIVRNPTSIDAWRSALNAVIDLVQECILEGKGAGGMHFANCTFKGSRTLLKSDEHPQRLTVMPVDDADAKVIYVFAPGSPFEGVLNKYMSSYSLGVDPNNPLSFLDVTKAANSSSPSTS